MLLTYDTQLPLLTSLQRNVGYAYTEFLRFSSVSIYSIVLSVIIFAYKIFKTENWRAIRQLRLIEDK